MNVTKGLVEGVKQCYYLCMEKNDWFDRVCEYTERLVRIRSISPGPGEVEVAHEVLRLLHVDGMSDSYTLSGLDPLEGDFMVARMRMHFCMGKVPIPLYCWDILIPLIRRIMDR